MSATLNLYSLTLAHGDATATNNPSLRFVDWKRALQGVAVENPKSERLTVPPGVEVLVFDGSRSLAVDGTTAFDLTTIGLAPDRYRLTHSGGTAPAFRTDRGLNLTGVNLSLTAQANGSLLVAAGAGTPFAALQAGDEVFIPGPETGDPSTVFLPANEGRWSVLAVGGAGANVTLVRPAGTDPLMASQNATPTSADQFQGFSGTGVQIGDKVDISAGFAVSARKTFSIVAVTAKRLEFTSTTPLAAESDIIPGAAGLKVFSNSKRFIRIEADQECVVRLNGDTGSSVRLDPWVAGDPEQVAEFVKVGPSWSLKLLNYSTQVLHANIISAE